MCYDRCARMLGVDCGDASRGELNVDITVALPQIHRTPGSLDDPRTEVLIRHKEDVTIGGRGANDFLGVAACADDIGEGFHAGAAINVGNDVVILVGMLSQELRQLFRRARFGKRAASVEVWQNHFLGWVENLGGLSHEMHSAEEDDFGIRFRRLKAQA